MVERGDRGRFDVFIDGELIAERKTGFFNRLLQTGIPSEEEIARLIRNRIAAKE